MSRLSTADADVTSQRDGTADPETETGWPITLWFVTGAFALSAALTLLQGDSMLHTNGAVTAVPAALVLLVIAGGLWHRQRWAIVGAIALQAAGLLLAFLTVDFPAVVGSLVLLGAMFAIPAHVWE
ncbi:hypothetical protein GCM10028857_25870 [Salinarchaeum chitinilyticum]